MKDEQKYLSPEQVTEAYCKALIAENHTLKQQNEELTSQLEKERKDNEVMGELLKEYEKQLNTEKWEASTNENLPEFLRISKVQNKIKSVLTNSGITI